MADQKKSLKMEMDDDKCIIKIEVPIENIKLEPSFDSDSNMDIVQDISVNLREQSEYSTDSYNSYMDIGTLGCTETTTARSPFYTYQETTSEPVPSTSKTYPNSDYENKRLIRASTSKYMYQQEAEEAEASTSKTVNECGDKSETKKTLYVWDHFVKIDYNYAICKHCNRKFSHRGTTGNLNAHLKRAHKIRPGEQGSLLTGHHTSLSGTDQEMVCETYKKYGYVWKYFDKLGEEYAMCKYCYKKLCCKSTTGNLVKHLKGIHMDLYLEYKLLTNQDIGLRKKASYQSSAMSFDNNSDVEEDERFLYEKWMKQGTVWDHFVKTENHIAVCKYCKKSISYKGTTGNLTGHLKRKHKSLYTGNKNVNKECAVSGIANDNTATGSNPRFDVTKSINKPLENVLLYTLKDEAESDNSLAASNNNTVNLETELKPENYQNKTDSLDLNSENNTLDDSDGNISIRSEHNILECIKESTENNAQLEKNNENPVILETISVENVGTGSEKQEQTQSMTSVDPKQNTQSVQLKLLRKNLIWNYFERVHQKSAKCISCQKIFHTLKEIPIILHLKDAHKDIYKEFILEQLPQSNKVEDKRNNALERMKCKTYYKDSKQLLAQHFERKIKNRSQCTHCSIICYGRVPALISHLEKAHREQYLEYMRNVCAPVQSNSEVPRKLKKNAVPSFLPEKKMSELDKQRSSKAMVDEENMAKVKTSYSSDENPNTKVPESKARGQVLQDKALGNTVECRACLKNIDVAEGPYDIFQPWYHLWDGMESSVAVDLAKIAKIQITPTDVHSKFICRPCYQKLRDACAFTAFVKRNDQILRLRSMESPGQNWPKPMQVNKSLDSTIMEVDIKQEVLSEPECDNYDIPGNAILPDSAIDPIEIKKEPPEEVTDQAPLQDFVNGNMNTDENNTQSLEKTNGDQSQQSISENVATQSKSATEDNGSTCGPEHLIRKDFCLFCRKLVSSFPKHIAKFHADESEVQPILMCEKKSVERKQLLTVLRKKGNYIYNEEYCLKPIKRSGVSKEDYLPCPECLGFYTRKLLWVHQRKAHGLTSTARAQTKAQNFLLKDLDVDKRLLEEVFPSMRANKISLVAKRDSLIRAYGADYLSTHKLKFQVNMTSKRMRELARILIEIQKMDPSIKSFAEALQPQHYQLIVLATKIVAGYNENTGSYSVPTLAMAICSSLKQCCYIAIEEAENAGKGDSVEVAGFKETIHLFERCWKYDITKKAADNLNKRRKCDSGQMTYLIPLANNVKLFNDCLTQKSQYFTSQLTCSDETNVKVYTELQETVLCRVLLFNRRRATEIENLKLDEYDRVNSGNFKDICKTISLTEQVLMKLCKCVLITGRKGQFFPVYFTPEVVKDINILRSRRAKYFTDTDQMYLFGKPGTNDCMKGMKVLEKHGKLYNCKNYKALSCMKYRKHVSILSQIFNMTWLDVQELLKMMELKPDHNLPDNVEQAARICKILLANDDVDCNGKAINDVELNMDEELEILQDAELDGYDDSDNESCTSDMLDASQLTKHGKKKRVPVRWTPEQREVVLKYFSENIKMKKTPKLRECNLLKDKFPELLHNKDWVKIKAYVQNYFSKLSD